LKKAEKLHFILSSPVLFCKYFTKIVDKSGKSVPFVFTPQQQELIDNMDRFNIVLKLRQCGISVAIAGYAVWLAITQPNSNILLASYSSGSVTEIFAKLKQIFHSVPMSLRPKILQDNRDGIALSNGSRISVGSLQGRNTLKRGATYRLILLSEWSSVKDEKAKAQLTAVQAALQSNGELIIESTALGCNHYYDEWNQAVNGESLFKPFFFGWIQDRVLHKKEQEDFSKRYAKLHDGHLAESELDETEQGLIKQGATLQQLEWRRLHIVNDGLHQFNQEYPSDPLIAFISTSQGIFDADKIQKQYSYARANYKPLSNVAGLPSALKIYMNNQLTIWDTPHQGMKYYISCDSSENIGADYTDVEIYDADAIQCVQFRTNRLPAYVCAEVLYTLAVWFNKGIIGVELASTGNLIIDKLLHTYHYYNVAKSKQKDQFGKVKKKTGLSANAVTKPMIIGDFQEWFDQNLITIKSLVTLQEMQTYQIDAKGSTNAIRSAHDDAVMSTAWNISLIKNRIQYMT
jgi:hypothetical protein